ncbi:hypothetical protein OAE88_00645 [bacterium]|nr:hypothetical protein [bacterium]
MATLDQLEAEMNQCKIGVYASIDDINTKLNSQDTLRNQMNDKLDDIWKQALANHGEFHRHAEEEMLKYDEMINSVKRLTETMEKIISDTKTNSGDIQSIIFNDEMDKRVAEQILQEKEPRRKELHELKMAALKAAISVIVVSFGGAVWFAIKAYAKLEGMN